MPNYCDFSIKIVGKEDDCKEFVNRMKSYEAPNHFYRIFTADVYETEQRVGEVAYYICGDCAWSLESCCRASGYSNGIDLFEENTRGLNLKMEAYSREPGMCFEEHYIYDHGECLVDECLDINVWCWDRSEFPTYADLKADDPDVPPEGYFSGHDGEEYVEIYLNGFGDNYEKWHI